MHAEFPRNPARKLPLPEVDGPDSPQARELVEQRQPFRCKVKDMPAWDIPYLQQKVGQFERKLTRTGTEEIVTMSNAELLAIIAEDPGWKAKYLPTDGFGPPINFLHPVYKVLAEELQLPSYVTDPKVLMMMRNSRANASREYYDTPSHYELNVQPAIYIQTSGRKHLWLFSPDEAANLGVESAMFESPFVSNGADACTHPDKYPQLAKATCYEIVLEPGDFVYWPEFWFHWFVHYHDFQMNLRIDWDVPRFELNPMSASWAYSNALASALGGFANMQQACAQLPPQTRELLVKIEQSLINDKTVLQGAPMTKARKAAGTRADQPAYKPPTEPKSGGS